MTSAILMLLVGSVLFVVGAVVLRYSIKENKLSKPETFSKSLEDVLPGIGRSHGAVRSKDRKTLVPDSRVSTSYLESHY
ncbi:MAG: hypothetical protein AB2653_06385 [Candidatus Thiodiazotropha endolucinida]